MAEAQTPSCVLVPEVTEGPYFVDAKLRRSDIRSNSSGDGTRAGIPLTLRINIVEVGSGGSCSPVRGAVVDIWHCDAEGVYSGVEGSAGTDFLRGQQVTDDSGAVTFTTIFPGWYRGRAVHIHLKVRTYDGSEQTFEYTSQLFFSETTIAQASDSAPYSANGEPDTSNASDMIYAETGGTSLVAMSGSPASGYTGTVTFGLSDVPDSSSASELAGTSWVRDGRGRRRLVTRLDLDERMRSVRLRLTRGGETVASRRVTGVARGVRSLRLPVPSSVASGPALLVVTLRDSSGEARTLRRRVRVANRRA